MILMQSPPVSKSGTYFPGSDPEFSLWFQNGTVYPVAINNFDHSILVNGQPCGDEIIVVRNNGSENVNLTMSLVNPNFPSNLNYTFKWGTLDGSPPLVDTGESKSFWFTINAYINGRSTVFSYNFNVLLNGTSISPNALAFQKIILVKGTENYSQSTTSNSSKSTSSAPNPTAPTPTSNPTSSSTSTSATQPTQPAPTATSTPTATPFPTPTQNPNPPNTFSDDFSSGNFDSWTQYLSPTASMSVINGVAQFNTPSGGNGNMYAYIQRNGFTATINSTITASQDLFVPTVPQGFATGNGAIFFLYVTDAAGPNSGNIAVGIDGSDAWSLWVGGNLTYKYVFQTTGATPQSYTWYHIVLTINNSAQTTSLAVNGTTVITANQQQFTDRNSFCQLDFWVW